MQIAVFCSSSNKLAPIYYQEAEALGSFIGKESHTLVYGASKQGLMESLAKGVKSENGYVIGILPSDMRNQASKMPDELFFVENLAERKDMMMEYADVFVALPGGFGTLDELFEVIASAQVGAHNKKIVLVNVNNFFNPLIELFEAIFAQKFCDESNKNNYVVVNNVAECAKYLNDIAA